MCDLEAGGEMASAEGEKDEGGELFVLDAAR